MKKFLFYCSLDFLCILFSLVTSLFLIETWPLLFYAVIFLDLVVFIFDLYMLMKTNRQSIFLPVMILVGALFFSLAIFLVFVPLSTPVSFLMAFALALAVSLGIKITFKLSEK